MNAAPQPRVGRRGKKKIVFAQSRSNRSKIFGACLQACVGEEHAEVRRHPPRARCAEGSRRRRTNFFAPRLHAWPRVRTGARGAPSVGRVRAALQGAREGAVPARPAAACVRAFGGHRFSLIHATATLGRWACMRATRAARRMRSKLNRARS